MTEHAALRTYTVEGIEIAVFGDKETLGQAAAARVAGLIRAAIAERGHANVIFATGASQYEFIAALRSRPDVAWPKVTAFHLDEYLGLPVDHPAGFRRYLNERLFDRLPFAAVHLLDGNATDPEAECRRYSAILARHPADVACIGIGENGHLAFNDPPADFATDALVHVVALDERCRTQQVGEGHFATFADVPTHALSLSIPAILQAAEISCVAPDTRKAAAVACALAGPVTPECPASALRTHPACRLYLDEASAAQWEAERAA